jgi:hypothetical protein
MSSSQDYIRKIPFAYSQVPGLGHEHFPWESFSLTSSEYSLSVEPQRLHFLLLGREKREDSYSEIIGAKQEHTREG